MKAVLDTNILIDYLNGVDDARREIERYARPMISPITWMEVLIGAREGEDQPLRDFLGRFEQVTTDPVVADGAVTLRRRHRIRFPDAIVWATARTRDALLVTRNTRDFPIDDPSVRMPYAF
jgi:predicted nucleic acid-binding protein